MMKKSLVSIAAVLALSTVPGLSFADDAAAPAASPISYNIGVVTDYRYRGISQTHLDPAVQGGVDYAGPKGIYLGTWLSNINWIKDAGGSDSVEWDLYGGWKGEVAKGLTLDAGLLSYVYINNNLSPSANTTELYADLTYSVVTVKYSTSVTNLFGFVDSKNSGYLEAVANFDLGNGWSLAPHVGHQEVKNVSAASYTDYSLTLGKDFGNGLTASLAVVDTDADKGVYTSSTGKFLGKSGLVAGVKYSF